MPLYRVLLEYEALVWSEKTKSNEVAEEVAAEYAGEIVADQTTFDATVRVAKVSKACQVPEGWLNGIPYGQGDHEQTTSQLLGAKNG